MTVKAIIISCKVLSTCHTGIDCMLWWHWLDNTNGIWAIESHALTVEQFTKVNFRRTELKLEKLEKI